MRIFSAIIVNEYPKVEGNKELEMARRRAILSEKYFLAIKKIGKTIAVERKALKIIIKRKTVEGEEVKLHVKLKSIR